MVQTIIISEPRYSVVRVFASGISRLWSAEECLAGTAYGRGRIALSHGSDSDSRISETQYDHIAAAFKVFSVGVTII
jgi:hypothetical protein